MRTSLSRRQSGQALVEFALVAPLLVLLLGCVIDFGLGFHAMLDIVKTAQDAASRGASKNLDDPDVKAVAQAMLATYRLDIARATVTVTHPVIEGLNTVRVDVSYAFIPLSPGVQAVVGSVLDLKAGAVYAKGS